MFVVSASFSFVSEFSTLYWLIGTQANFTSELSKCDAIYFAVGTLTTAGTGILAPTSSLAKMLVSGQIILDLLLVTALIGVTVTRWSERD